MVTIYKRHPKASVFYIYRIGRIPGVGLNLSAQRHRDTHNGWVALGKIRNLGTSKRAMRIDRLRLMAGAKVW